MELFNEESSTMDFVIESRNGPLNLKDIYFTPTVENRQNEDGKSVQVLRLTAETENGKLVQTFSLEENSYQVQNTFEIDRYQGVFTGNEIKLNWEDNLITQEMNLAESRRQARLN
ncbi:hypothetical protein ACWKSR_10590, partial [Campylobacter fetus subsp. venerealis]